MNKYKFPDGYKFKVPEIYIGFDHEAAKRICIAVAEYLDEHPGFTPMYSRIFNAELADNEETIAMAKSVFETAGMERPKIPLGEPVPFPYYIRIVNTIVNIGWDGLLEHGKLETKI